MPIVEPIKTRLWALSAGITGTRVQLTGDAREVAVGMTMCNIKFAEGDDECSTFIGWGKKAEVTIS
jgi:hypothetical protein